MHVLKRSYRSQSFVLYVPQCNATKYIVLEQFIMYLERKFQLSEIYMSVVL